MLTVLHPPLPLPHNAGSSNDQSLVVLLQQGRFRMLLTGDAGEAVESKLLESHRPIAATALKVSHHGAISGTTDAFVQAVSPQVAIISVGADNRYGHPDSAVIDRLEDAGALVLRTDQQGTIALSTDGDRLWVETTR